MKTSQQTIRRPVAYGMTRHGPEHVYDFGARQKSANVGRSLGDYAAFYPRPDRIAGVGSFLADDLNLDSLLGEGGTDRLIDAGIGRLEDEISGDAEETQRELARTQEELDRLLEQNQRLIDQSRDTTAEVLIDDVRSGEFLSGTNLYLALGALGLGAAFLIMRRKRR